MSEEDDIRRGLRTLVGNPPPVGPLAAAATRRARAARSRQRAVLVATALVVVAGTATVAATWRGGDQASRLGTTSTSAAVTESPPPAMSDPATPTIGTAYPYQLFVHCGVRYALFGGRWWEATPPQSPPPGPPGRDGNYVTGTMTLTRADRVHFRSTDPPLEVDFRPAPAQPPLCQ